MVQIKPSPYNPVPLDTPLEVSRISKFKAGHIEITAGIVNTDVLGRQIVTISWGYPEYATTYALEPICATIVNPEIAYLRHLENIQTALHIEVMEYDYTLAQVWRQIIKWANQNGFNYNLRTLQ